MPSAVYPYTVTNSYKGGLFMRTYSRNVRRAWDGQDYRAPKRQCLDYVTGGQFPSLAAGSKDNITNTIDLEDNLERAIRETSVAALSSSPSRKNSTIFSLESREEDNGSSTTTPPSSPPPTLQLTPPNIKVRKPTFSALDKNKKEREKLKNAKRKYDASHTSTIQVANSIKETEPLSEIKNPTSYAPGVASNETSENPESESQTSKGISSVNQKAKPNLFHHSVLDSSAEKPAAKKQNLIQTILDLGQSLTATTCSQCQMSYTPSLPEDVSLHNMWHNRNSQGIDLGKPFLKSAMKWCYEVPHIPGSVVVVDRKISLPSRKAVQRVLEVINKELGSVEIKEEELWSQRALDGEDGRKSDRYKVFIHVIDDKCVGVCLAERISKAHKVVSDPTPTASPLRLNDGHEPSKPDQSHTPPMQSNMNKESSTPNKQNGIQHPLTPTTSSSISVSEETYPAVVGVSRIWTSKAFRRKGIANNLLDCVMNQFIYGMEMERTDVAFSQPTESGAILARSWFGEDGWAVYRED